LTGTDTSDKILANAQRLGSALGGSTATDLAAPASGIGALIDGGGYSNVEGTSFAAPLVSGSIVLLQSIYKQRYGSLPTVDQLQGWLKQGARTIHDDVTGIDLGRLDVLKSASLIPGAPAVPTTPVVTTPTKPVVTTPTTPVVTTPTTPVVTTPTKPVVVTPPAQQVLTPPTTPVDYTPVTPTVPATPTAPATDDEDVEPTPTTLLNGTTVQNLTSTAVDQAASTTKLAKADVGQLLRAMSKWASGSKVRAWSASTSQ